MKTKLTLSIDAKIVKQTKREAKRKGISLSKLYEEKMTGRGHLPDKKKQALLELKKMLLQSKPAKTVSRSTEKKWRSEYLMKKHG